MKNKIVSFTIKECFPFKNLIKIFNLFFNNINIVVNERKVCTYVISENEDIMSHFLLETNKLSKWKYNSSLKRVRFGIELRQLDNVLDKIKKKDEQMTFSVFKRDKNKILEIKIQRNSGEQIISEITLLKLQNSEVLDEPSYIEPPIKLSSNFVSQTFKNFKEKNLSTPVKITRIGEVLQFNYTSNNTKMKIISGGSSISMIKYDDTFSPIVLYNLNRINSLSDEVNIFLEKNKPILISTKIGSMGKVDFYIKSNSMITDIDEDDEIDIEFLE